MKAKTIGIVCLLFAVDAFAINQPAIIPAPQKMELHDGQFDLGPNTRISVDSPSRDTGRYLMEKLDRSTGFQIKMVTEFSSGAPVYNGILLTTRSANTNLGPEGYELAVTTNSVIIQATTQAGLFYGVQTLLQLLPPEIFSSNVVNGVAWRVPCVQITDWPRFQWRGLMLDVSRHFFTKPEVEQLLDAMALHKLSKFHWHLTDDDGWRIEIDKYPRLTSVGAWRDAVGYGLASNSTTAYGPDGRYGGFYTQADIREVVAYAAARHITIVPEIEMPAHSWAALAAYPQFRCGNGPFDPANPETFNFLENVLTEVFSLFPGKYIHIGGDEVSPGPWENDAACRALMKREGLKTAAELESWFMRRIEEFIEAHGRVPIGWSEVASDGLATNAVVMDWIGGGKEAASAGHDVVMTPTSNCYFDYYQSLDHTTEPRAIGGYLPLEKVYAFDPMPPALASEYRGHILGAQGNVWTEYIPNFRQVEYMAFPRLCALAEVTWSPKAAGNYDDFLQRLKTDEHRLDELGVNYRCSALGNGSELNGINVGSWSPSQITTTLAPLEWDVTSKVMEAGQVKACFDYTTGANGLEITGVALLENGRQICHDTHNGFAGADSSLTVYTLDVAAPKPGEHYTLQAQVAGAGGTNSHGTVSWVFVSNFTGLSLTNQLLGK